MSQIVANSLNLLNICIYFQLYQNATIIISRKFETLKNNLDKRNELQKNANKWISQELKR